SEESIYGRFGYGLASFCGEITLAREHTAFAQSFEPEGTPRLIEPEEAQERIPSVYERIRFQWPGMFSRNDVWWENRAIADPEERRDGAARSGGSPTNATGRSKATPYTGTSP